jgi:hypothetical protein
MTEFEQQRRQKLLDENFYDYFQKILIWERKYVENSIKSIKNPFMEPMIDFYYQQLVLDYTVGKPITDLLPSMETIIKYTNDTIAHVEQHNQKHPDNPEKIIMLSEYFETEKLSNLLGLCILFERQDWFETIVKAVDLDQENREKAIDSLIAMKIPNYPITEEKTPRLLSFRNPLYKAIHAEKLKDTLKFLDEYLRRWYDGLRKAGNVYIDIHLLQQGDSQDCCTFHGYWCFEAAAVAYLKDIDDSTLHRFMYYPKDMVEYARANHGA